MRGKLDASRQVTSARRGMWRKQVIVMAAARGIKIVRGNGWFAYSVLLRNTPPVGHGVDTVPVHASIASTRQSQSLRGVPQLHALVLGDNKIRYTHSNNWRTSATLSPPQSQLFLFPLQHTVQLLHRLTQKHFFRESFPLAVVSLGVAGVRDLRLWTCSISFVTFKSTSS